MITTRGHFGVNFLQLDIGILGAELYSFYGNAKLGMMNDERFKYKDKIRSGFSGFTGLQDEKITIKNNFI